MQVEAESLPRAEGMLWEGARSWAFDTHTI